MKPSFSKPFSSPVGAVPNSVTRNWCWILFSSNYRYLKTILFTSNFCLIYKPHITDHKTCIENVR